MGRWGGGRWVGGWRGRWGGGWRSNGARAGAIRVPDSRTGDNVGGASVGVNLNTDARITHLEGARERRQVVPRRLSGAAASNTNFSTLWVELRSHGLVKGENFMADKVIAGSDGSRDRGGPPQGLKNNAVAPFTLVDSTGKKASFVDLEPDLSTSIPVLAGTRALGKIDSNGSLNKCQSLSKERMV